MRSIRSPRARSTHSSGWAAIAIGAIDPVEAPALIDVALIDLEFRQPAALQPDREAFGRWSGDDADKTARRLADLALALGGARAIADAQATLARALDRLQAGTAGDEGDAASTTAARTVALLGDDAAPG